MANDEPQQLVRIGRVASELGVSVSRVRQLADEEVIPSRRTEGGHRLFDLGLVREALARRSLGPAASRQLPAPTWGRTLPIVGLAEDAVWQDLAAALHYPSPLVSPALRIMRYAFTEMLNNAIDHSAGTLVQVQWWDGPNDFVFVIRDDGQGIFAHVRDALALEDHFAAIQELSKGKTTTNPREHTGEGIFFTSKAVDVFEIGSNGWRWAIDNLRGDQAVGTQPVELGTSVLCEIDIASTRNLTKVLDEFTGEDHAFSRSRVRVKLFELGVEFVSRSEAKRLLRGLERFHEVEVDFKGVQDVGQGFVDELIRVWPAQHPETRIVPINMNRAVEAMIRRGLPHRP
jgi:anti-sigma regulatory factor (Ser/Thr protein kinase)